MEYRNTQDLQAMLENNIRSKQKASSKIQYLERYELNRLEIAEAVKSGIIRKQRVIAGFNSVQVYDISQTVQIESKTVESETIYSKYKEADKIYKALKPILGINTDGIIKNVDDTIKDVIANIIDKKDINNKEKENAKSAIEYVIMHKLGLSTINYKFRYINDWAEVYRKDNEGKGKYNIKSLLREIASTSDYILSRLEQEFEVDTEYNRNEAENILKMDMADKLLSTMEANIIRTRAGGSQL